ncbi:hypothetical protein K450DRAFT_228513 [Umbelopsis ramanniana AG]|uniref:Uncharacterized protein n=1 Tax=Umbelopsis ramanniana AG TaxID=1314678 RepID=A0AAD5EED5_UMBRA|nr:uncharacterized protein K450DRAFT_228513 [Umbelopsis ramanniana AG]KAI8582336.1 hypothetical protein K450DRAFT_228513 [Umbelopsis ramanniana AG]
MREFWTTTQQKDENCRLLAKKRFYDTVIPVSSIADGLGQMLDHYAHTDPTISGPDLLRLLGVGFRNGIYRLSGPFGRRLEGVMSGGKLRLWRFVVLYDLMSKLNRKSRPISFILEKTSYVASLYDGGRCHFEDGFATLLYRTVSAVVVYRYPDL